MKFVQTTSFFFARMCCFSINLSAQGPVVAPSTPAPRPRAVEVVITGNLEFCKGGETVLKAEGDFESFEWKDGSTGRYLRVKEEGVYEVSAKTKGGCTYVGSVNVRSKVCI
jgi:hypothetical protein